MNKRYFLYKLIDLSRFEKRHASGIKLIDGLSSSNPKVRLHRVHCRSTVAAVIFESLLATNICLTGVKIVNRVVSVVIVMVVFAVIVMVVIMVVGSSSCFKNYGRVDCDNVDIAERKQSKDRQLAS